MAIKEFFKTIPNMKCVKQIFPSPDITVTSKYTYFNKLGYFCGIY